jgi:chemotaxis signal transduction protein
MILIPLEAERSDQKFVLLAERVDELRTLDPDTINGRGSAGWSGTLALGPVIADEHGLLQILEVDKLIAEARRNSLLPPMTEPIAET